MPIRDEIKAANERYAAGPDPPIPRATERRHQYWHLQALQAAALAGSPGAAY
jgi:hypothetical protein